MSRAFRPESPMQLEMILEECPSSVGIDRGLHLIAEWHECRAPRPILDNLHNVKRICVAAVSAAGLTLIGDHYHVLQDGGITGMVLLAESYLAIRTWPGSGRVALDVLVCGHGGSNREKARSILEVLRAIYRPDRENLMQVSRGV